MCVCNGRFSVPLSSLVTVGVYGGVHLKIINFWRERLKFKVVLVSVCVGPSALAALLTKKIDRTKQYLL